MAPPNPKALALLCFAFCAQGARRAFTSTGDDLEVSSWAKSGEEEPPILCDTELVEEACFILNGGEKHARGDDWTNSEVLRTILSSSDQAFSDFWDAADLPTAHEMELPRLGFWVTCEALCTAVVDYGREHGVMPLTSDVACYNVGMETKCDLPMSPSLFPGFGPKPDQDLPDFHDEEINQNVSKEMSLIQAQAVRENRSSSLVSIAQELSAEEVDYDLWELCERIANFFRIYPTKKPEPEEDGNGSSLAETSSWPYGKYELHQQKAAQSKAYMSIVIRAFNLKKTQRQMSTWFGSSAFTSSRSRTEILRVLNSVDHMISNVEAVYEGPQCSPNTYAYVYPKAYTCNHQSELKSRACTKYKGKFVFYLCALYLNRPSEMVETLVHEGSHHATSYTDDVSFEGGTAYGRSTCQRLARRMPSSAIKNADNFCYYIEDVATQVSVPSGSSSGSSGGSSSPGSSSASRSRCFTGTVRSTPDSEGDCRCRSGYTCYKSGRAGCPFSRGSRSSSYGYASCSDCMCHSRSSLWLAQNPESSLWLAQNPEYR